MEELNTDSTIVVVATVREGLEPDPFYGDETAPLALVQADVLHQLSGPGAAESVTISVEASYEEDGTLASDKLRPGATYLLFLSPDGPKAPGIWVVTGYLAGLYGLVDGDDPSTWNFERLDAESPQLPSNLTLADVVRP